MILIFDVYSKIRVKSNFVNILVIKYVLSYLCNSSFFKYFSYLNPIMHFFYLLTNINKLYTITIVTCENMICTIVHVFFF